MMRPCLGSTLHEPSHTLTNRADSRCTDCAREHETARTRAKRARRPYTYTEQQRRKQAVDEWKQRNGDWCPGWEVPPHPTPHLTADHPTPVARGGSEHQQLEILCRSCNSRKGAQTEPRDTPGAQGGTQNT